MWRAADMTSNCSNNLFLGLNAIPGGEHGPWRRRNPRPFKLPSQWRPVERQREMSDKAYLIRFKHPDLLTQSVAAACVETHGDHLVLLNSEGKLTALFLAEVVESWCELPSGAMPAVHQLTPPLTQE
jgi:hypothetical protein